MTDYAIIASGGKQYRVQPGDVVDVELLGVEKSGKVEFDVLLLSGPKELKLDLLQSRKRLYEVKSSMKSAGRK